jgi:hypothetical protein
VRGADVKVDVLTELAADLLATDRIRYLQVVTAG